MGLFEKTEEYNGQITDRWHTPGHKGFLWREDISEISNGDYFPSNLIDEAQKKAAAVFGTKHLRFLTGGSSMGIKAAILAVDGDIIAGANSHRSVFEGASLSKKKVFIIENTVSDGLALPLTKEQVTAAIQQHKSAKAVVITSPDYFGRTISYDVIEAVKASKKILIADSAHGAHFSLREDLFPKCLAKTADFCNMSAHKTLCALTMGAYLAVNNEKLLQDTDTALKNLGTTSPLYPLLSSLENALNIGQLQKPVYDILKKHIDGLRKEFALLQNDDFTRIVIDASQFSLDGKGLYEKLFLKKIAAEMYYERYTVFIATPFDDEDKFNRLKSALSELRK